MLADAVLAHVRLAATALPVALALAYFQAYLRYATRHNALPAHYWTAALHTRQLQCSFNSDPQAARPPARPHCSTEGILSRVRLISSASRSFPLGNVLLTTNVWCSAAVAVDRLAAIRNMRRLQVLIIPQTLNDLCEYTVLYCIVR